MTSSRLLICCFLCLTAAACTYDNAKRLVYDVGQQYSCNEQSDNLPNPRQREFDCITQSQDDAVSFDEYRRQRSDLQQAE
ncbi:MAG: hypothetical protein ACR2RB_23020 [Gammaproteobacteria bacterium]